MTIDQEIAFGLWERQDGNRLVRDVRDLDAFRRALGDDLIVGFAQLFVACGRLDGLLALMGLNNTRSAPVIPGREDSIHDPDSIAADRNRMILGGAIWGTFHEVIAAVDTLQKAALTKVLRGGGDKLALASWKTIRTMAHRWRGDIETKARNQFAFHLGDADVMRAGLAAWPSDEPLVISTTEGQSRNGTNYHFGFDLLCRGLGIQYADHERLTKQGIDDRHLPRHAMRVFFGVLHAKGAPIPGPSEMEAPGRTEDDEQDL